MWSSLDRLRFSGVIGAAVLALWAELYSAWIWKGGLVGCREVTRPGCVRPILGEDDGMSESRVGGRDTDGAGHIKAIPRRQHTSPSFLSFLAFLP